MNSLFFKFTKFPLPKRHSAVYRPSFFSSLASQTPEQWLQSLGVKALPVKSFSFQFDRSSGPGGQKVNKSSSKCTLTIYGFSKCNWIPQDVRDQLMAKNFRYWAKSKDRIVIQSDKTRSRETNRDLCLEKLVNEVKAVCWFAKPVSAVDQQKWETVRRKTNDSRLKDKKLHSDKKQFRKKTDFF
ncbi:LAME_0F19504g1_1 [Lachancea meyersii CBS 8951]|uniref:LAME_0F19504g1_1 n=1 Tax=Lachancea meyersii CBS 8951 TaxID=1266667 RepID=A0A1G4K1G6_9SACH|nr:LAME_0F19504g1_1 [Lachancea meyersii CBS 8951]